MNNKVLTALKNLKEAANALNSVWLDSTTEDESLALATGYPFEKDFDAVANEINNWQEAVQQKVISGKNIDVGYIPTLDITVIFDFTEVDYGKIIDYYYGEPNDKLTKIYAGGNK